jgi:gamma-glutamylcyclotransferase
MNSSRYLYFAYGSNMSSHRLRAADRAPSAWPTDVVYLDGYRLTFDKVGRDGSAKCDCERTGNRADRVYGVVYSIALADKARLDAIEGVGIGYDDVAVEVVSANGVLQAHTYSATIKDAALAPFHWYKQHVLDGAREWNLPAEYVRLIEQIAALDDPARP